MKRVPILGCIADDVTGATDLAINLVQGGMCVVQLLKVPSAKELEGIDADAIVVGLKTRSIPKDDAVRQSLETLNAFRDVGIERCFFKYCSTFDSTDEGNIGPVSVALLDQLNAHQTIFCPAFPRNGRTVYQGHLFVYDKLLNESGMESHPLNPMTDPNLVRFLGRQCDRTIGLLGFDQVQSGAVKERLDELEQQGCSLVIADACDDGHLRAIASAVSDMPLVTGGSGIGRYLPDAYRDIELLRSTEYVAQPPEVRGRSLIIAGSCSQATNKQVAWMQDKIPCWEVNVEELMTDRAAALHKVIDWAHAIEHDRPALIYSTALPACVAKAQEKHGAKVVAKAIEELLSDATARLVSDLDVSRIVVAGGETSGAVVQKLGVNRLRIGAEICAGVPWTESLDGQPLALALKSGNFGDENFFEHALGMLP